ncbi:MAG: lipocalin-like domain-containing protein [Nitrospirae bacterium]|nr:lipocalin-like domain-containing protein [Nitrospirota bacterium]
MKRSIKEVLSVLLVVAVLAGGMLFGASKVWAQEKGVQGSWILVELYNETDGKRLEPFGPNPRGSMLLTPDGHFSMTLMRSSLPKFASNVRTKGTAEEYKAVVDGSVAAIGTYTVTGDKEQILNLHIVGSTFPNWDGQDQKRPVTVIGDDMKIINPAPSIGGGGKNTQVWKRAK